MKKQAILCVDDEKMILNSLRTQLSDRFGRDYIIEIAENTEEGFEVIEDFLIDKIEKLVVISDWLMPGMKGDEFLAKVHELYPQAVTILLSGQADEDCIQNAKKQTNSFSYMSKPWDREELFLAISIEK